MAYQDARDHIKTVLAGLSITSPADMKIVRVYEEPPATVEDWPCFIMYGPAGSFQYSVGGAAIDEGPETEKVRLVLHDEKPQFAAELVRAFRAALIAAFKTEATLGGHAELGEVRWDSPGPMAHAGREDWSVQDFYFAFRVKAP